MNNSVIEPGLHAGRNLDEIPIGIKSIDRSAQSLPLDPMQPYRGWKTFLDWAIAHQDVPAIEAALAIGADPTRMKNRGDGACPLVHAFLIYQEFIADNQAELAATAAQILDLLQESIARKNSNSEGGGVKANTIKKK